LIDDTWLMRVNACWLAEKACWDLMMMDFWKEPIAPRMPG